MYARRAKPTYILNFRQKWLRAYSEAQAKVRKLGEGWEILPQTVMGETVKKKIEELRRRGNETEQIKVADWLGKPIYLIAYKPSPRAKQQAEKELKASLKKEAESAIEQALLSEAKRRAWAIRLGLGLVSYGRVIPAHVKSKVNMLTMEAENIIHEIREGRRQFQDINEAYKKIEEAFQIAKEEAHASNKIIYYYNNELVKAGFQKFKGFVHVKDFLPAQAKEAVSHYVKLRSAGREAKILAASTISSTKNPHQVILQLYQR